ncbi:MAG: hypothetical protein EOP45_05665, partial [Sphingobacteriaceae bacterium]
MQFTKFLVVYGLLILPFGSILAQSGYSSHVQLADDAYQGKTYIKAALAYRKAFSDSPDSVQAMDVYRSARCWSAANNTDSAFIQLRSAVFVYKFGKYGTVMADPVLFKLHQDKRWSEITLQ